MIRLGDTDRLDRMALGAAIAGALCAVLASILPGSIVWVRYLGPGLILVGVGSGWRAWVRGLVVAGAVWLGYASMHGYPLFADVLAGCLMGAGLCWMLPGSERATRSRAASAAVVALAGASWPLALEAFRSMAAFAPTQSAIPPVILDAAGGGLAGIIMGLTAAPLFLMQEADPVSRALSVMPPAHDPELKTLVLKIAEARSRALTFLKRSRASGASSGEVSRSLDSVALTAIELTIRFAPAGRVLARSSLGELDRRCATARQQLVQAADPGIRRDLERTIAALEQQRDQVDRLAMGRQRLLARLQSELALLEKTEMSFALLASGDAALAGVQLESIGTGLIHQAQELEAEGSALQEMLTLHPRDLRCAE